MAPLTDRRIGGRYELTRVIARGGGGTVWAGYDHLLEREVAVKHVAIPGDLPEPERETIRARVRSEARAAARLLHPAAVAIFDVVGEDGDVHLVLELVDAPTLDALVLRDGPLDERRAARLALGLLDVLTAAHARGIVHRDVKPSNIFVVDGDAVKLTDFGIAAVEGEVRLTRTGATMGSPQFIAPEQALGHDAAPSADLWGLGASLYLAVEGVPPFERNNAVATVHAVVHEPARPLERADRLRPVIAQLLEKEPSRRPEVDRLRADLARIAGVGDDPVRAAGPAVVPVRSTPGEPAGVGREVGEEQRGTGDVLAASVPLPTPPPGTSADEVTGAGTTSPPSEADRTDGRPWRLALLGVVALVLVLGLGALLARTAGSDPGADGEVAAPVEDGSQDEASDGGADGTPAEDGDGAQVAPEATDEPDEAAPADDAAGGEGGEGDEGGEGGASTDVPEADVPADWQAYDGPAYTVAVPAGWQAEPGRGRLIDLQDPDSPTYLRVDWTPDPQPDPYANWEAYSQDLAERFEDYQQLQLEEVTFRGEPAALLEYTYTAGGAELRAYNLNILYGDRAYALNLQSRAEDWDQVEPLFPAMVGGFEPS